jgi:hypothetical protein
MALTKAINAMQTQVRTDGSNKSKRPMSTNRPAPINLSPTRTLNPNPPDLRTQAMIGGRPQNLDKQFISNPILGNPSPMGMSQDQYAQRQALIQRDNQQFMPPQGMQSMMPYQGVNTLVRQQPMTNFGGGLPDGMIQDLAGRYGLDANALFGNFQMPQVSNQQTQFQQMPNNNFGNQPMTRFPDSNPYMNSPYQMGQMNQMNNMNQPMQQFMQQPTQVNQAFPMRQPMQQPMQQPNYPQMGGFATTSQTQNLGGLDSAIQNMNRNNFSY